MPPIVLAWAPARASCSVRATMRVAGSQKQVAGPRPLPEDIRRLPSSADVFKTYSELRRERNDAKSDSEAAKRLLGGLRAKLAPYYLDQVAARYRVAVRTENRFASDWCISGPTISRCPPTSRRCSRSPARWRTKRSGRTSRVGSPTCCRRRGASRDDPVPRQSGVDRSVRRSSRSVAAGARRPAIASSASTRTWRAKSSSCTRSASMAATRSRTSRRSRARSPVGRSAPTGSPAAASSASSRFTTPRTSQARRPSWARATVNQASRSRAPC